MAAVATTRALFVRRRVGCSAFLLLTAAALIAGCWLDAAPVWAQASGEFNFPTRPQRARPGADAPRRLTDKAPMLVQATEMQYDYTNKRVSAVGNVQVYYAGTTVEADRLIYDETTKRIHAEGNVRMTEADGRITYAEVINLSDDFRDGFVDSLRLDAADQTRMAAARADRSIGN